MADSKYMDDKLYEAARWSKDTQIPLPSKSHYLRVTPGDGSNALHVAARHGNHTFLKAIVSRVDPKQLLLCAHNDKGETPLHLAAEYGSLETVEAILKAHDDDTMLACWREKDKQQGDTPVHRALRFGHDQTAKLILERDMEYLVTLDSDAGESLVYLAARNSCPHFLHKILDVDRTAACELSFSGPFGQTAFHLAWNLTGGILLNSIERRKHLVKVQDNKGKTILHYAVEEERGPVVEILLKADNTLAYLHDNGGMTPLHIACSKGFLEIIQIILKLCPQSITVCEKHKGQTALHVVKMDGYTLDKCLKTTRMKELVNQVDDDGNTPLHLAVMHSDIETADKLLVVDGINWRLTNKLGYSALDLCTSDDKIPLKLGCLAREYKAKEVLKMDVFFHKNVVIVDDVLDYCTRDECLGFKGPQGDNIFHIAARDGNSKMINRACDSDSSARTLLLSGQNSNGETSLHLAAEYGHLQVVQSILSLTEFTVVARGMELMSIDPTGVQLVKPWRIKSGNGDTPAHKAIRNRHNEVALLLLQQDLESIHVNNDSKESLLYLAAKNHCFGVIKWISSKRIVHDEFITSGRCGENFFHAAAKCPRRFYKFYMCLISEQPHLLGKVDDNRKTPLHHAIEEGGIRMTRWLLNQDKSAAFVYDNEGFTPLLRAASLGRSWGIREILTACPQSAKLRDLRYNRTVLHLAKMPGLPFLRSCMRLDALKRIVNETDKDGNTALHCAILDGDVDKALVLLQTQGINLTITNNQHKSPLNLCLQLRSIDETKQRPIYAVLLTTIYMGGQSVFGSLMKSVLLVYHNLIMSDENLKKMLDNIAVAAALLVTITFAAAFTIPGGYDQNTGDVMLMKKASVKVFVASDIIAMLMAISILIWYTLGGRRTHLRKLAMDCIVMLLISLTATIVSFISGVFAIGWHAKSIVIVPILIAALLNLFFIFRNEFFEIYF